RHLVGDRGRADDDALLGHLRRGDHRDHGGRDRADHRRGPPRRARLAPERSRRGRGRMTAWVLMAVAVATEVAGTLSLRLAATGRRRWYLAVTVGYLLAFASLAAALAEGMPLGVAYGIWAAAGGALTALGSRVFLKEPLTRVTVLGIAPIMPRARLVRRGTSHWRPCGTR